MMSSFRAPQKDVELAQPPGDSVSKLEFSPTQDVLAVASWDNNVMLNLRTLLMTGPPLRCEQPRSKRTKGNVLS